MIVMLIEMTVCMLLLWGIYQLLLTKSTMHKVKRVYLLLCLILPLTVPFIELETDDNSIPVFSAKETLASSFNIASAPIGPSVETNPGLTVDSSEHAQTQEKKTNSLNSGNVLLGIYGFVTLALLIRYSISIYTILRSTKTAIKVPFQGSSILVLDHPIVPHNFLRLIFISQQDYQNEAIRDRLLTHELNHARQLHSIDVLIVEFFRITFWFNPLYVFLSKAIRANHEYLADAAVIKQFSNISTYQKLLLSFAGNEAPGLSSPSNYSLTKKRFIMMKRKTQRTGATLRLAIVLPLIALITMSFTLKTVTTETVNGKISALVDFLPDLSNKESIPNAYPLDQPEKPLYVSTYGLKYRENGKPSKMELHTGFDFVVENERTVLATADGIVTEVKTAHEKYGNYVHIKHNDQYTTIYASLDELMVTTGQEVKQGEALGTVGKSLKNPQHNNSRLYLHYEVLKNGKNVNPLNYFKQQTKYATIITVAIRPRTRNYGSAKKYGLQKNHFIVTFPSIYPYEQIMFDEETILFFKSSSSEPIIKKTSDFSEVQLEAIRTLESSPIKDPAIRRPTDEIVKNWLNPSLYGIWIDSKRVDNADMSRYTESDFAHYFKSNLLKKATNYGKHTFQLNLTTNAQYQKDKVARQLRREAWKKETAALIEVIGDIE